MAAVLSALIVAACCLFNTGLAGDSMEISTCLVDFDSNAILYSYKAASNSSYHGRSRPYVMAANGDRSVALSPYFQIASVGNSDEYNYDELCYDDLRVCYAYIGLLTNPHVREGLNDSMTGSTSDVQLFITGDSSASDHVPCMINGVDLQMAFMPMINSLLAGDAGYEYGFDPSNRARASQLGDTIRPTKITTHIENGNLIILEVEYFDAANPPSPYLQVIGFDPTNGAGSVDLNEVTFVDSDITAVEVVTTGGSNPVVCGIVMYRAANSAIQSGCTNGAGSAQGLNYTIDDEYRFAGFFAFQDQNDNKEFLLTPMMYHRLEPRLMLAEAWSNSAAVYITAFFPSDILANYTVQSTNMSLNSFKDDLTYITSSPMTAMTVGEWGIVNVEESASAGCVPFFYSSDKLYVDGDWKYESGASDDVVFYTSRTVPVVEGTDGEFEWGATSGGSDVDIIFSSSYYSTANDECNMRMPMYYLEDFVGGHTIYMDGYMSYAALTTDVYVQNSDIKSFDSPINKIEVFATGGLLDGLAFYWNSTEVGMIGDNTTLVKTIDASADAASSSAGAKARLTDVDFFFNTTSKKYIGVDFFFGMSSGPEVLLTEAVEEDSAAFYEEYLDADEKSDADLRKVYLWVPEEYDVLKAEINGFFISDGEDYTLTLMPDEGSTFDGSEVVAAYLYHLQPEHRFNVTFHAEFTYDESNITLESAVSDEESFTTSNGIRTECFANGTYHEQIEWESLPDIEVLSMEVTNELGNTITQNMRDTMMSSADSHQMKSDSLFFHYDTNPNNYPKYMDFEGYPKEIYLYFDNSGGEDCIRGLGMGFGRSGGSTNTIWLTGSQAEMDGDSYATRTLTIGNKRIVEVTMTTRAIDAATCVHMIGFEDEDGNAACYGNQTGISTGDQCGEVLFTAPLSGMYLYSMDIVHALDSSQPFRILAATGKFASVAWPTVQSGANCVWDDHKDFNEVRNTAWTNELDWDSNTCNTNQVIYADHESDSTDHRDQEHPDGKNHHVMYQQKVTRSTDGQGAITGNTGGMNVTRSSDWQANLFCYYDATGQVDSSYGTMAEDGMTMEGANEFHFSMAVYHDDSYTSMFASGENPTMLLNAPVFMAVELEDVSSSDGFYVRAMECWASDSSSTAKTANSYYSLTDDDGCEEDSTFEWNTASADIGLYDEFQFNAFAWYESGAATTETVYVHCRVRACLEDNTDGFCDRGCLSKRQRRDVASSSALARLGQEEREQIVSSQPIFVQRRAAVDTLEISRETSRNDMISLAPATVASLFSMFATVMFFSLLVVSYKVYKLRNRNYRLLTTTQQE